MDVTQALKDAENALRDFIETFLREKYGLGWIDSIGVSPDRLEKWKERKETEAKRQQAGVVEERVLYYADFYDLSTILKKNWDGFASVFGEWKTMEVWLKELERLRDPDAHRRELMPHQKHLVLGISGEIRNRIVRYRSKQEAAEDFFPRIESARDSLGNIWTAGGGMSGKPVILHPGDVIEFIVTAFDPFGEELEYGIKRWRDGRNEWQNSASISTRIEFADISNPFIIGVMIKSRRAYPETVHGPARMTLHHADTHGGAVGLAGRACA
jgi:hypothetical protein